MASASPAILSDQTGAVLRITFNRPDSLNALTSAMLAEVAEEVETRGHDDSVRVLVLTGAGRAFSSGADLRAADDEPPSAETVRAANRLIRALRAVPKPVVAAVNGAAAGVGCSIALAADLTVACESAYFLLAFARIGLMSDGGATALLPAAIGRARATKMAMLAERVDARTAERWGLIAQAVPDADLEAEVEQLVAKLAAGPTAAYAQTKHAFNATALAGLETALEREHEGQTALFSTADFAEGATAFREKRAPRFSGK